MQKAFLFDINCSPGGLQITASNLYRENSWYHDL